MAKRKATSKPKAKAQQSLPDILKAIGIEDADIEAAKLDIEARLSGKLPESSTVLDGDVITVKGSKYFGFSGRNVRTHALSFSLAGANPVLNGKPRYSLRGVIENGGEVIKLARIEGGQVTLL